MATIWPAAAGAEPLELRAGGHRRGRPAGLRGGGSAEPRWSSSLSPRLRRRRSPPRCWRASPLRWAPGWMKEDLRQRSGRRSSCTTPAGKRLRRDCQPGAAAGSRHGAGTVSAASGAVYAPEQRLTRHLLLTVDGDDRRFTRVYGSFMVKSKPPARRLRRWPSDTPTARARWTAGGWAGSAGLLYPQLEEALFALAENALSAPVASELGWHLIWCEAIRPAAPMTPEQALESARDYLSQQSQRRHQRQWLAEMLARQPAVRVADRLPAIAYSRCGLISSSRSPAARRSRRTGYPVQHQSDKAILQRR